MSRLARPCWAVVHGSARAHFVVRLHRRRQRANDVTEADTICGKTFASPSPHALPEDAERCGRCTAVLERAVGDGSALRVCREALETIAGLAVGPEPWVGCWMLGRDGVPTVREQETVGVAQAALLDAFDLDRLPEPRVGS